MKSIASDIQNKSHRSCNQIPSYHMTREFSLKLKLAKEMAVKTNSFQ